MNIRGIPIRFPTSGWLGLFFISWLVIPRVTTSFPAYESTMILIIAFLHAIAIYLSVFIHELGHAFTAQKYGYQPKEIVLNLIGGHTAFAREFDTPKHQILIAFFGPLANSLVIVVGYLLYAFNPHPIAESLGLWLVWASAITTIINLFPGFPLDGGAILGGIVWSITGNRTSGLKANAIGGLMIAGLWFLSPWILEATIGWVVTFTDVIISSLIGSWLMLSSLRLLSITKAESQATVVDVEHEGPRVSQFVRRSILVPAGTDLQEALLQMRNQGAGAIVVMIDTPVGIVRESAYQSNEHGSVQTFARRIDESDVISMNSMLRECTDSFSNLSSQEWLVVDENNKIFGVLMRSDLEGAL